MNAIENQQLCSGCIQAILHGGNMLSTVPKTLKRIIETEAWLERRVGNGRIVKLNNLRELITKKPLDGWGEDPAKIEAIIRDDHEVLTMWREAMKTHGNRYSLNGDNINLQEKGTSRSYTDSRLKRQYPDLFELVKAGKLSANAAAIKAGWRKKKTPLEQLHYWWQKCTQNEKREFLNQCTADLPSSSIPS
jgi:hypothetical protein